MESMTYTPPASWDDKGLDWSNPDPRNLDYLAAIIEAAKERVFPDMTGNIDYGYLEALQYFPLRPLSLSIFRNVAEAIGTSIAPQYLNTSTLLESYEPNFGGQWFPVNNWMRNDFLNSAGTGFLLLANAGTLDDEIISRWLVAAKTAISELRYRKLSYNRLSVAYGKDVQNYVNAWDPRNTSSETCFAAAESDAKAAFLSLGWGTRTYGIEGEIGTNAGYGEQWEQSYPDKPYRGRYQISVSAPVYKLNPVSEKAEITLYLYFPTYRAYVNSHTADHPHSTFIAAHYFPDDNPQEGRYCRVTLPVEGGVIDLKPLLDGLPPLPSYSDLPEVEEKETTIGCGFSADDLTVIGDFNEHFDFK